MPVKLLQFISNSFVFDLVGNFAKIIRSWQITKNSPIVVQRKGVISSSLEVQGRKIQSYLKFNNKLFQ